jgi:hypothetical protein
MKPAKLLAAIEALEDLVDLHYRLDEMHEMARAAETIRASLVDEAVEQKNKTLIEKMRHDRSSGPQEDFVYEASFDEKQRLMFLKALKSLPADEEVTMMISMLEDLPDTEREIPGCHHGLCL